MNELLKAKMRWISAAIVLAIATMTFAQAARAQDDQYDPDDPPDRVARLGYLQGSVSMQPAGESDWVGAVSNRPMTTGDKLWADQDSRAEIELGSATIRLAPNTGFSFLNLDDRTTQIELTAGSLNVRVRRLDRDDVFEIDTPNQAFSIFRPGNYRVDASEDGGYTVISVRDGEGESTGNGQTYTLHAGQRGTFSGTDSLNAEVVQINGPDEFDNWAQTRDRRYDNSRSAQYVSHDMVGYADLDDYGDWRDDSNYGHVWYPSRVESDWAPYRSGHWDWIAPWGWTWVDDAPWGYAPFHYGRWVVVSGRWGWIAGPVAVRPVYAPALVVFIGGGGGFGVNVGWFPLGPREVYVPSYRVSRGYVNRVNISNTTVNVTHITNVYNTTIINRTTNVTNVRYVNRNVRGAVTAVPQRTFVSAQSVTRARVNINDRDIRSASLTTRVNVAPTRESVLGARANTANRVTSPPERIRNRQVIAKVAPPPPPVSFEKQRAELQKRPGEALTRREVQNLRPANKREEPHPMVKVAPPGKPATPNMGRPGNRPNQPGDRAGQPNQPDNARPNRPGNEAPGQPGGNAGNPAANRPDNNRPDNNRANDNRPNENRPADNRNDNRPNDRPGAAKPDQPDQPVSQPDNNRPADRPNNKNDRPARPDRQPDVNPPANQPETKAPSAEAKQPNNRPDRPTRNERPAETQPNNSPDRTPGEPTAKPNDRREAPARNERQPDARPERPNNDRPSADRPNNDRADRPPANNREPAARPDRPTPPPRQQTQQEKKQQQQEEKKQQQEEKKQKQEDEKREKEKRDEKPPTV